MIIRMIVTSSQWWHFIGLALSLIGGTRRRTHPSPGRTQSYCYRPVVRKRLPALCTTLLCDSLMLTHRVVAPHTGKVISSFGGDHGFVIPHGVFVDHTDCIWVTDCGLHQVFKFDRKGTLLFTLGIEGGPDPDRTAQKDSDNSDPCVLSVLRLFAHTPCHGVLSFPYT